MKVICISGKAGAGKDTFGKILKELLEESGKNVLVTHYADLLKYMCKTFFGWNGEKDEAGRTLLQHVGTDIVRNRDENFWVRFVLSILNMFPNEWDYVLIPDCRFKNEIDTLKESGIDVMHVSVIRKNTMVKMTDEQKSHPSETAMDSVTPDIIINNNYCIKNLISQTKTFVEEVLHEK